MGGSLGVKAAFMVVDGVDDGGRMRVVLVVMRWRSLSLIEPMVT